MAQPALPAEILFEITVHGEYARVAAVDPASGAEAIAIGPAGAALADLKALAARKLARLLAGEGQDGEEEKPRPDQRTGGRGFIA